MSPGWVGLSSLTYQATGQELGPELTGKEEACAKLEEEGRRKKSKLLSERMGFRCC